MRENNNIDITCRPYGLIDGGARGDLPFLRSDNYKLIYVLSGELRVEIDGKAYSVGEHCSALVYPFSSLELISDSGARYFAVAFNGVALVGMLSRTAFSPARPVSGRIDSPLLIRGFHFISQLNGYTPFTRYRQGGGLIILLSYYMEHHPGKNVAAENYVVTALELIDRNFMNSDFGVADIAKELKIDRTYLYRLFKKETNMTVVEYLVRRRIYNAEILLANSDRSIRDVAVSSGFSDQLYFSRVFKRVEGKTPSEFRGSVSR